MSILKKLSATALAVAFAVGFAGCAGNEANKAVTSATSEAATSENVEKVKTGYSVISSFSEVEKKKLTINSVLAGVIVDKNGRIVDVKIDEAQTKPDLEKDNGNVSELASKRDRKDDYGMKPASSIDKEWYQQAEAFEKWAKGKTTDEISNGIDDKGYAADADLKAGCTINVSGFLKATIEAVKNADEMGASDKDNVKIKISVSKSSQSSDKDLQYDTDFAVVTVDDSGKVTSCLVDSCQAKCEVNDGQFEMQDGTLLTKKQLGSDYGMKPASSIDKEWYQQAEAFEKWAVGKNAEQIKSCTDDEGYAKDADLKAGCTIKVTSIASTVADAIL